MTTGADRYALITWHDDSARALCRIRARHSQGPAAVPGYRPSLPPCIRRESMSIDASPPCSTTARAHWSASDDAILGTMTDAAAAARLGRTAASVSKRRRRLGVAIYSAGGHLQWTDSEMEVLGTGTDEDVAVQLGRSIDATRLKRQQLGIAPHPSERQPYREWTDEDTSALGTMSDRDVATALGRTVGAVKYRRSVLGIQSWGSGVDA